MKFKRCKQPKTLVIAERFVLSINREGEAHIKAGFGEFTIGPRAAISLARWMIRYSKWSSLL